PRSRSRSTPAGQRTPGRRDCCRRPGTTRAFARALRRDPSAPLASAAMRVTVTGGSGLIGSRLVAALRARGAEGTVPSRAGTDGAPAWDPLAAPAPAAALEGRDAVIHLAGEPIAQRWSPAVREAIAASRRTGTANLVAGIEALAQRPRVLVSANAVGYYGDRGAELLTEASAPGTGYLAEVCVAWEHAALGARELGLRVCVLRTGVVLDRHGGALAKMLPPFRLG